MGPIRNEEECSDQGRLVLKGLRERGALFLILRPLYSRSAEEETQGLVLPAFDARGCSPARFSAQTFRFSSIITSVQRSLPKVLALGLRSYSVKPEPRNRQWLER